MWTYRSRGKGNTNINTIVSCNLIKDGKYIISGVIDVYGIMKAKLHICVTDPQGKVSTTEVIADKDGVYGSQLIADITGDYLVSVQYENTKSVKNASVTLTVAILEAPKIPEEYQFKTK